MSEPSACAFIPYDDKNPYQRALGAALERLGVRVVGRPWKWRLLEQAKGMDIVHIHWIYGPSHAPPWKFALAFPALAAQLAFLRLTGRRLAWTVHNLESHERPNPIRERLVSALIGRMANAVIVHGESARQLVAQKFRIPPRKIRVIPHGNYVGLYPATMGRAEARRQLGLRDDQPVALFLGNIRPYKGVHELLGAFRRVDNPNAALVLAGRTLNPEMEAELRALTSQDPRVQFHPGFIEDDRIQVYMAAADAVVFPYREVLTSGAVVLAMSFGRACIAPRIGCIPDVLDSSGGFLYDADDPDGLAAALDAALASDRLAAMGGHNRTKADQWSWGRIAAATYEAYGLKHAAPAQPERYGAPT